MDEATSPSDAAHATGLVASSTTKNGKRGFETTSWLFLSWLFPCSNLLIHFEHAFDIQALGNRIELFA